MTPEQQAVIDAAAAYRDAIMGADRRDDLTANDLHPTWKTVQERAADVIHAVDTLRFVTRKDEAE